MPSAWRPLAPTVERHLIAATRVGQDQLPAVRELLDELANLRINGVATEAPD